MPPFVAKNTRCGTPSTRIVRTLQLAAVFVSFTNRPKLLLSTVASILRKAMRNWRLRHDRSYGKIPNLPKFLIVRKLIVHPFPSLHNGMKLTEVPWKCGFPEWKNPASDKPSENIISPVRIMVTFQHQ